MHAALAQTAADNSQNSGGGGTVVLVLAGVALLLFGIRQLKSKAALKKAGKDTLGANLVGGVSLAAGVVCFLAAFTG